jgi:O-antigen/teichoic acid export membrane protein
VTDLTHHAAAAGKQDPAPSTLGDRARSGMAWSLLNSVASRLLTATASLVIARIVSPAEFGTYTAAVLVMTIALSMNEIGLSVAVIRWKGSVERIAPTAVSGALASSAAWSAAMFLAAPAIAAMLNAPQATIAIRVLAVAVLLDGVSTIPNALLMRAFQQQRRAAAGIVGFLAGTPIGIYLAGDYGASGLAVGLLIANLVTTVLTLWLAPSRPRPGWSREDARRLIDLGLPAALTSMLLLAIVNVDSIVVSRVLGVAALGFYALAFNVANWPWRLLSMAIRQVALPAFSRLSDDGETLEEAFSHSLTLAAGLAVLGGILLAALAEPVVVVLYGSKWLPAVEVLRWLAIFGALRVVLELCYDLLVAVGRAAALVRLQLGWIAALAVALPVGARLDGIVGVAIAQGLVAIAVVLPLNIRLLIGSGVKPGPLIRSLQPVVGAGVASAAMALLALQVDTPRLVTLIGASVLIVLAYCAAFIASSRGRAALRWANAPLFSNRQSTRSGARRRAAAQSEPATASAPTR